MVPGLAFVYKHHFHRKGANCAKKLVNRDESTALRSFGNCSVHRLKRLLLVL